MSVSDGRKIGYVDPACNDEARNSEEARSHKGKESMHTTEPGNNNVSLGQCTENFKVIRDELTPGRKPNRKCPYRKGRA
jgi:hypothetical protein